MPAKALSSEQRRDAARLKQAFKLWQSAQKDQGKPWVQDDIAEPLFGFGQSALSQYINGKIPLNAAALATFSHVLGIAPENISPTIVKKQRRLSVVFGAEPEKRSGTHG